MNRTVCPSCGELMCEPIIQSPLYVGATEIVLEHCTNHACPLEAVTLTRGTHINLSPELIASYGASKRSYK